MCARCVSKAVEYPQERHKHSPLTNPKAFPKQKVKAMAEFSTAWLIVEDMPQYGVSHERLGDLLVPGI